MRSKKSRFASVKKVTLYGHERDNTNKRDFFCDSYKADVPTTPTNWSCRGTVRYGLVGSESSVPRPSSGGGAMRQILFQKPHRGEAHDREEASERGLFSRCVP